jgi:signal transduction histidine kinase
MRGRSAGLTLVPDPKGASMDGMTADSDARWLAAVLHSAFVLLVLASAVRFLTRHDGNPLQPWVIVFTAALVFAYGVGTVFRPGTLLWLTVVLALWIVLVVLAPSFAWSAIPLLVTGLRTLPAGQALALVAVITALVVVSQNRLADGFDPNLTVVPIAIAAVTAAVITFMRRQAERLRESERRAGVLTERHRVSRELHDALAQGLSSQAMLLQAADQAWDRPELAREHVRAAQRVGAGNLAEARRLVQDLAPADLAGATLEEALRAVAGRAGLPVEVCIDGDERPLPERVQSTVVRIAQGALANAREHAGAGNVVVTLTYLDDQVVLDVADDGRGFLVTESEPGERGHGLPAMRVRAGQLGGRLTVESAPGQGTVVSAAIPLEAAP